MMFQILTSIWKDASARRHGAPLSRSKVMSRVSAGSISPKEESKDLRCDG
jgi:hypothetical protein